MQQLISTWLFSAEYRRIRFTLAFVFFFLIIALGSIPGARQEVGQLATGLVLHSLAYAVITFLLFTGSSGSRLKKSIQAFLIVAAMGALDECVQNFFPYRTAAISDWLVDCGASCVAVSLLTMLHKQD